jgi:peptide/nickel transport system substrate-binding protein
LRRTSSRRLRHAAALAALAALCVGAVDACGGSGTGGAGTPTTASAALTAHTFIDLVGELPTDLDETGTPDPAAVAILPSWSSELVRPAPAAPGPNARLPPDDAVVPYLATSWQRAADGSYTFALRRGVRGDSGDPFTAADVRWSLERAAARSPVAPFLFALGHIDAADPVTIIDSHTVRVNVTSPSPFTLSVLASDDLAIYDSALYRSHATAGDRWAQQWGATHSASFGAYWVQTFLPRREIVLAANPGFWGRPYYTRVIIREVFSPSVRLTDVLAGSATHTSGLDWEDFDNAVDTGAADGVRAGILQTGPAVVAWHLDVRSGPLANPLVRQALNLSINRAELASGLYGAYDQPTALTIPAAFGQTQPSEFDPEQSRSLLRSAGYPTPAGLVIDVYTNNEEAGGWLGPMLTDVSADLLQIGVNLRVVYVNDSDQLLALEQSPGVQSSIDVDTPLLGGPGVLLEQDANTLLDPVSRAAEQHYSSTALQSLLDQLLGSSSTATTVALIAQAAASIDATVPTINLVAIPVQNVTRANVTGYSAYTQPVTYYEYLHPTS